MSYRNRGRGTLVIDKVYAGIRICRASGTNDKRRFRKLLTMLDELAEHRLFPILHAISKGRLHVQQVWQAYRHYGIARLPSVNGLRKATDVVEEWLTDPRDYHNEPLAAQTARDYRYALKAVLAQGDPDDTVSNLPIMLQVYRDAAKPRMFNLARSACQSFARTLDGRFDPLWQAITVIPTRAVPKRKKAGGQTPDRSREIAEALGLVGRMWWTMCTTGMGPKEYLSDGWTAHTDRVAIHGRKRDARERIVPKLATPTPPTMGYKPFLEKLTTLGVKPYDARRTFMHWMEMCGIPRSRRRYCLGHKTADVDGLYEDHDVEPYLAEDRRKLLAFIGEQPRWLKQAI
jgi:hypothetical protein